MENKREVKPSDVFDLNFKFILPIIEFLLYEKKIPYDNFLFENTKSEVNIDPWEVYIQAYKLFKKIAELTKCEIVEKKMDLNIKPADVFEISKESHNALTNVYNEKFHSTERLASYEKWLEIRNSEIIPSDVYSLIAHSIGLITLIS